eukprot:COSAG05_NODE_1001_length_6245_cov_13.269769_3_plen_108_part_00
MDLEISVELPTNEAVFLQTTIMADPSMDGSGTGGVTLQLNISAPNVRCQTDRLLLPVSRSSSGALLLILQSPPCDCTARMHRRQGIVWLLRGPLGISHPPHSGAHFP